MYFTCKSHLFLLLYHSPPQNCMARADCATPPSPSTTNVNVISLWDFHIFPLFFLYTHYIYQSRLSFFSKFLLFMYSPKIATIFMNSHVKFIFFLLLYHSPPQKASERTGKSGPTFQHLHRLNHHQFVRYLVVEI